jgi:predicted ATPase
VNMLDSISIRNFKAIGDVPLELKELANVNYLVGKNGCGKSSVLEMINFINNLFSDSGQIELINEGDYKGKYSIKIFNYKSKYNWFNFKFSWNKENCDLENNECLTFIEGVVNGYPKIFTIEKLGKLLQLELKQNKTFFSHFEIKTYLKNQKYLNSKLINEKYFLLYTQIYKILDHNILSVENKRQVIIGQNNLSINEIASGYDSFLKIISFIIDSISNFDCSIFYLILIIDEPELNLHPDLQKKIPSVIKKIIEYFIEIEKKHFPEHFTLSESVQFIISTHSPFIISAAAEFYESQKVYLIEDGQTVDLEGNLGKGQEGYSGGECLLAVNRMLGSNINDVAPHVIIFCERTLKSLIENYKPNPSIILTDKSGGSDDRIKVMTEIFDSVRLSDKVNFLNYNIFGVIDQCGKETNWKKQLKEKLIVIDSDELEQLYDLDLVNKFLTLKDLPEWDKSTCPKFSENYCKINEILIDDKGSLKNHLAIYIGQNTDKEFLKIVSQELHDLIFN